MWVKLFHNMSRFKNTVPFLGIVPFCTSYLPQNIFRISHKTFAKWRRNKINVIQNGWMLNKRDPKWRSIRAGKWRQNVCNQRYKWLRKLEIYDIPPDGRMSFYRNLLFEYLGRMGNCSNKLRHLIISPVCLRMTKVPRYWQSIAISRHILMNFRYIFVRLQ